MKPAPFGYMAPRTVDEVVEGLATHGDRAKVIAGGQSLGPLLNLRLARPEILIDLNAISGLESFAIVDDGSLEIRALARYTEVHRSADVAEGWPVLRDAIAYIGHRAIRNRGTLCGSLAHADPAAEMPTVMSLLDARVVARSKRGVRTTDVNGFFTSYFTTSLTPDEMILRVEVPPLPEGAEYRWLEVSPRQGDFLTAGVGISIRRDVDGSCAGGRAVCAGIADVPWELSGLDELLAGRRLTESVVTSIAAEAQSMLERDLGKSGASRYRLHLIGVLLRRGLRAFGERSAVPA